MATGSADGSELSIEVPQPLEEWLDERAEAVDVDRAELVVQLLASYRAVADQEEQVEEHGRVVPLEEHITEVLDDRLDGLDPEALDEVHENVTSMESELDEKIDDLRHRVLQIKEAVKQRANADHDHEEFADLSSDVEALSSDLDEVATDLVDLSGSVDDLSSRLEVSEERLTRLARIVVALRETNTSSDVDGRGRLERVRRAANRRGVSTARCAECRHVVRIGLLSEPNCPHCDAAFDDVSVPSSILGPLDPRSPELVGTSSSETGDEDA